MDVAVENSFLSGQLLNGVILRECNVYVNLAVCLCADQLLLESRNEHMGTELQLLILGCAAIELVITDEACEVE